MKISPREIPPARKDPSPIQASHRRALEDEEIGVRYRIFEFYLPLFLDFCATHGKTPAEVRVLDCGCGNGASVEYLASAGFQSFGIDIAPMRFEQWSGRVKLPRVTLIRADATALPFADDFFDIAFSSGMLEHIGVAEECTPEYRVAPLPDQRLLRQRFIAESLRVVRPDGIVYVDHPNGAFPIDFWHNDYRSRPRLHSPFQKFLPTFREVADLCKSVSADYAVEAISPAGRFTFRRSERRWYGKLFSGAMKRYLRLLQREPLRRLAASPLNPYLVIRIERRPLA
jgi:SAM-dependent methyltransferase